MEEDNFLTLSSIPWTFPPNRFPGSFSFHPFLGSTAVSLNLFHQWLHPFHPSSTLCRFGGINLSSLSRLPGPCVVAHTFVGLPSLFQITPSPAPSSFLRATFPSLRCANCRASTPVLPSVWKDPFPCFTKYPSSPRFWLECYFWERCSWTFPISIRCNFCGLNRSLYFLPPHCMQFIGIYLLRSIFFFPGTSALHLSGKLTMIGILLSLLTGVPATASTLPGTSGAC